MLKLWSLDFYIWECHSLFFNCHKLFTIILIKEKLEAMLISYKVVLMFLVIENEIRISREYRRTERQPKVLCEFWCNSIFLIHFIFLRFNLYIIKYILTIHIHHYFLPTFLRLATSCPPKFKYLLLLIKINDFQIPQGMRNLPVFTFPKESDSPYLRIHKLSKAPLIVMGPRNTSSIHYWI